MIVSNFSKPQSDQDRSRAMGFRCADRSAAEGFSKNQGVFFTQDNGYSEQILSVSAKFFKNQGSNLQILLKNVTCTEILIFYSKPQKGGINAVKR